MRKIREREILNKNPSQGFILTGIFFALFKFRKLAPHALKGQKLLAQGIALGIIAISKAPCKGKSFVYCPVF